MKLAENSSRRVRSRDAPESKKLESSSSLPNFWYQLIPIHPTDTHSFTIIYCLDPQGTLVHLPTQNSTLFPARIVRPSFHYINQQVQVRTPYEEIADDGAMASRSCGVQLPFWTRGIWYAFNWNLQVCFKNT